MKILTVLKIVGMVASIGGLVCDGIKGWSGDKLLDAKIDTKVAEAVAKLLKKEGA